MDEASSTAVSNHPAHVCIACLKEIPRGAHVCTHCHNYQSDWRNEIRYWAGVAGIITLIASGLVFTADLGSKLWRRLFGHEIAVTNIDPFGKTLVWNLTGSAVHLRTVGIQSTSPKIDLIWEVHQTVPASGNAEIELMAIAQRSWYGPPNEMYGKAPAEYAHLTSALFDELKRNLHTDKYVPTFLMPNSESFAQLKRFLKNKYFTFDCTTSFKFVRLSDGSAGEASAPCQGSFRHRAKGP